MEYVNYCISRMSVTCVVWSNQNFTVKIVDYTQMCVLLAALLLEENILIMYYH